MGKYIILHYASSGEKCAIFVDKITGIYESYTESGKDRYGEPIVVPCRRISDVACSYWSVKESFEEILQIIDEVVKDGSK